MKKMWYKHVLLHEPQDIPQTSKSQNAQLLSIAE